MEVTTTTMIRNWEKEKEHKKKEKEISGYKKKKWWYMFSFNCKHITFYYVKVSGYLILDFQKQSSNQTVSFWRRTR